MMAARRRQGSLRGRVPWRQARFGRLDLEFYVRGALLRLTRSLEGVEDHRIKHDPSVFEDFEDFEGRRPRVPSNVLRVLRLLRVISRRRRYNPTPPPSATRS